MEKKISISKIIKLNKVIDSCGYINLTVFEAFELYKFNLGLKTLYSFLKDNSNSDNFDNIIKNDIIFNLPNISAESIVQNAENSISDDMEDFLREILDN